MSDPREERLPKWATETLRRHRQEINDLRHALVEMKGSDPRQPVAVRDPHGEAVPVTWDEYDIIRFYFHGAGGLSDWIDVWRTRTGEIEVSASRPLHIRMQAPNVMYIIEPPEADR